MPIWLSGLLCIGIPTVLYTAHLIWVGMSIAEEDEKSGHR